MALLYPPAGWLLLATNTSHAELDSRLFLLGVAFPAGLVLSALLAKDQGARLPWCDIAAFAAWMAACSVGVAYIAHMAYAGC